MKKALTFAAIAACVSLAAPARAAVITDVELIDGESVTFASGDFAGQSGLAGQIQLTTSTGDIIHAWCIDLYHDVFLGGQNPPLQYTGYNLVGASNGNGSFLTSVQAQEIAGLVNYGNQLVAGPNATADLVAGVQMAIWAIENPGLTFSAPDGAVAAELYDLSLAPSLFGSVESLVSLTGTQELAAYTNEIPEPGALGLMVAGLMTVGFARRKAVRGGAAA